MKIFVLITENNSSLVVSGIYSTKTALIQDLTTKFNAETINSVELWELDKGFIEDIKISRKTTITIED